MTSDEAIYILRSCHFTEEGGVKGDGIDCIPGEDRVFLDGPFSSKELEALLVLMKGESRTA